MNLALLVGRLVLATVFVGAGAAKLADLDGSRTAVKDFGVPERLARAVGLLVPLSELAVGVALIPTSTARYGALGAIGVLIVFSATIANALTQGRAPDCHCFGQIHSAPASWKALARNVALTSIAVFVTIGGWNGAGDSATSWFTSASAAVMVATAAGVVIVALFGFQAWFCFQLLSQNGRLLGRLKALEDALARFPRDAELPELNRHGPSPMAAGLSGGGLAVGSIAPHFSLAAVDGPDRSLRSLLSDARPLVLIFSEAECRPCAALLPEIARWQDQYRDRIVIALISSGDSEKNRAKVNEHHIERALLQKEREVSDAYEAPGTPTAVVIGTDGTIQTPVVGGADMIRTLLERAARRELDIRHTRSTDERPGKPVSEQQPRPDSSRVGQRAPALELSDLDGGRVALKDLYEQRTVAIFWSPGCGFCRQMLPDLKALENDPPPGTPQLVVISAADPEQLRNDDLRSLVLLDPESQTMSAFDAHGTPMGVLIHEGRIASPVAAGSVALLELIHAARSHPSLVLHASNGDGRER